MIIPFSEVNLVAVVAATVACMALGFVWYNPNVFGSKWMKLTGKTDKPADADMQRGMFIGLAATFISNYFLAIILLLLGAQNVGDAITAAIIVWAATALPGTMHDVAWSQSPKELMYINASHALINYGLAAAILLWWPL